MDEIINRVAEKTGLPADKARSAVDAVLGFLKEKLPGPIGSQIDSVISGGGNPVDAIKKGLGGLLG